VSKFKVCISALVKQYPSLEVYTYIV